MMNMTMSFSSITPLHVQIHFMTPPPAPPNLFTHLQSFASAGMEQLKIQPAARQSREKGREVLGELQRKYNKPPLNKQKKKLLLKAATVKGRVWVQSQPSL